MYLKLESRDDDVIEDPTVADLLLIAEEGFAILSLSHGTYIQCRAIVYDDEPLPDPLEFILECQFGSMDEHYRAEDEPFDFDSILVAFAKFLNGDASWYEDFTWAKMDQSDFDDDPRC
ncbi:MAG: hypothetical protein NTY19_45105 [Planctomycetota bacterium]|nr:hypothetical protein [Planctomycetota bacterium]